MNKVLGILAHVDAGKTTLSESILYDTKAIRSIGRVDKKDAFLDTDQMEKDRGITIFSKQALFTLGEVNVTLLDTPGHVDFSPETERALWVLDYAILVVSAADGVQGHTKTLFSLLEKHNVPTFIFVNKMDQPGSDAMALISNLKNELSSSCVSFEDQTSDSFFEEVSLSDEAMMEYYLENDTLRESDIENAVNRRLLFPVFFGSALRNEGIDKLLSFIEKVMEGSKDEGMSKTPASDEKNVKDSDACSDAENAPSTRVYKITRDENGVRLTHFKVTAGKIKVRDYFVNDEKITQIRRYNGAKYETVNETEVGGVYAAVGVMSTYGGMGTGLESDAPSAELEPVMTYRVNLPVPGTTKHDKITDNSAMLTALNELAEDLPELHVAWDEDLHEIHVAIMGDVQLEILKNIILDRYDTLVTFGAGRIVYKETIASIVEGVGHFEPLRHYAEAHLMLEPGQRGSGITFESTASTDELALNWQRLIQTHVFERSHRGVLTGSVATDIKITLLAGRAHPKHTMGGDFRQATYRAIRQGLMQAQNVLLEPYYNFVLTIPDEYVGRAMTDLDRRCAKFSGPEMKGNGMSEITGSAPVAIMQDYPSKVVAYSGGRGNVSCSFAGYDICHNSEEVIESYGYSAEADIRNTPDSVFCSHGAGVVVAWNEVFDHMHIERQLVFDEDSNLLGRAVYDEEERLRQAALKARSQHLESASRGDSYFMGYEEVDAIVGSLGGANRGSAPMPGQKSRDSKSNHQKAMRNMIRTRDYDAESKEMQAKGTGEKSGQRPYKGEKIKDKYMLVDGYNVIYAWKELSDIAAVNIDGARGRLLDILSNYQAIVGVNLIAVFDAYRVKGQGRKLYDYNNIHVIFTMEAETADSYIEKFSHENSKKYDITVVTSDGLEQIIIMGAGCHLISSREFENEVKRANEEISGWHS